MMPVAATTAWIFSLSKKYSAMSAAEPRKNFWKIVRSAGLRNSAATSAQDGGLRRMNLSITGAARSMKSS